MSKFKVGDKVRRTGRSVGKVVTGEIYTVRRTRPVGHHFYIVEDKIGVYWEENFELVVEPDSKSDQQIADEYRDLAAKADLLRMALEARGFSYVRQGRVLPALRKIEVTREFTRTKTTVEKI